MTRRLFAGSVAAMIAAPASITFQRRTRDGLLWVTGEAIGQLAIVNIPIDGRNLWYVFQPRCGLSMGVQFWRRDIAAGCARELGAITDWSQFDDTTASIGPWHEVAGKALKILDTWDERDTAPWDDEARVEVTA